MSTPDIPDEQLDDFFKKSLGDPALDFREEDWLKLEKKLKDKQAREKALFRRFLFGLLGLLLLLVPAITWYVVTQPSRPSMQTVSAGEADKVTTENAKGDNGSNKPEPAQPIHTPGPEKAVTTTADQTSPRPVPEKVAPSASIATKQTTKPGTVQQNGLTTEENQPIQVVPFEKPINSIVAKNTKKQQPPDKQLTTRKTQPANPDLALGTPQIHTNTEQANNKDAIGNTLTTSRQKDPAAKQTSGITLNQPARHAPLADSGDQKENANQPAKNNSVADNTAAPEQVQEPGRNNRTSQSEKPIVVLPRQNSPDEPEQTHTAPAGNKLVLTGKGTNLTQPDNNTQYTSESIEEIPGLSVRLLAYETHLSSLFPALIRQTKPLAQPDSKDSTRRHTIAIARIPARISVNLLLSPDLSSIGFSQLKQVGTNLGISLEYHFSTRISVGLGAIYSNKIYEAAGSKYKPASSYWASYYPKPVDVKGTCKVLDVPVNIRYNVLYKEKYNLYVSGGMSSYFMLKENYKYIYTVDDPKLRSGWHGKNEYKHLFKVINISAGYERKLNQKFSLQAEPFIKLPTAGVGYGRIKLLSTGLFMSMKYNF